MPKPFWHIQKGFTPRAVLLPFIFVFIFVALFWCVCVFVLLLVFIPPYFHSYVLNNNAEGKGSNFENSDVIHISLTVKEGRKEGNVYIVDTASAG